MRVDIRKLDLARNAVDDAITELVLRANCTRIDAILALIRDLGFEAKVLEHEGWYFASASTETEQKLATRIYFRRGSHGAIAYETTILHKRLHIAYTFEDAVLALLCSLIDHDLDLLLDIFEPADRIECANRTTVADPLADYIHYVWDDVDTAFGPEGLKRELAHDHCSND